MKDKITVLAEENSAADLKAALLKRLEADERNGLRQNPNYFQNIERLNLTMRALHVLKHRNIRTIDELLENHNERSISSMKGCGRICVEDIRLNLKRLGLRLRRDRVELIEFIKSLIKGCEHELDESDFPKWFFRALRHEPSWISATGYSYENVYYHVVDVLMICFPKIATPEVFLAEKGFEP